MNLAEESQDRLEWITIGQKKESIVETKPHKNAFGVHVFCLANCVGLRLPVEALHHFHSVFVSLGSHFRVVDEMRGVHNDSRSSKLNQLLESQLQGIECFIRQRPNQFSE